MSDELMALLRIEPHLDPDNLDAPKYPDLADIFGSISISDHAIPEKEPTEPYNDPHPVPVKKLIGYHNYPPPKSFKPQTRDLADVWNWSSGSQAKKPQASSSKAELPITSPVYPQSPQTAQLLDAADETKLQFQTQLNPISNSAPVLQNKRGPRNRIQQPNEIRNTQTFEAPSQLSPASPVHITSPKIAQASKSANRSQFQFQAQSIPSSNSTPAQKNKRSPRNRTQQSTGQINNKQTHRTPPSGTLNHDTPPLVPALLSLYIIQASGAPETILGVYTSLTLAHFIATSHICLTFDVPSSEIIDIRSTFHNHAPITRRTWH